MPLASGCHHVALVTQDLDRLIRFHCDVFEAEVRFDLTEGPLRHALVDLGGGFCLHPFEFQDGSDHDTGVDVPFGRGHLDHVAIRIDDPETFARVRSRLVELGACDGTLVDYGALRSVWFRDPDGMGCEIATDATGAPRVHPDRTEEAFERPAAHVAEALSPAPSGAA